MIRNTLTIILIAFCVSACSAVKQSSESDLSTATVAVQASPTPNNAEFMAKCIADASKPEMQLKAMGVPQIYSHTGDFDGNGAEDFAVLVVSESEPTKGGLLVCRNGDSKQSSGLGAVFKAKPALSSFADDNFITSEWNVILKTESPKIALGPDGKSRIKNRNKGDVIAFFHEGGAVFIFWDGTAFRLVEGG